MDCNLLEDIPIEILVYISQYLFETDYQNFLLISKQVYSSISAKDIDEKIDAYIDRIRNIEKDGIKERFNLAFWNPENDKDQDPLGHVLINGARGSGKTSLMIHLAETILKDYDVEYYCTDHDILAGMMSLHNEKLKYHTHVINIVSFLSTMKDLVSSRLEKIQKKEKLKPLYILLDFETSNRFWENGTMGYIMASIVPRIYIISSTQYMSTPTDIIIGYDYLIMSTRLAVAEASRIQSTFNMVTLPPNDRTFELFFISQKHVFGVIKTRNPNTCNFWYKIYPPKPRGSSYPQKAINDNKL